MSLGPIQTPRHAGAALAAIAAALVLATASWGPGVGGAEAATCPAAQVAGTPADDDLRGDDGAQTLRGLDGDDRVVALDGGDCLFGDAGDDDLQGDRGADRLVGGDGGDRLEGGWGRDRLDGGGGNDLIGGGQERSDIDAGEGDDVVSSSNGVTDRVACGPGADRVRADRGDRITGCERVAYVTSPYGTVSPRSGGRASKFVLTFRALHSTREDPERRSYAVGVVHGRSSRRDCQTSFGLTTRGTAIGKGQVVRITLSPRRFRGGRWCPALYRGVLRFMTSEQTPGCAPDCPTRDVRLGRFFYRVR